MAFMTQAKFKYFSPDMSVAEAMSLHPRVGEVFAAFHLGGCAGCGIRYFETIEQVCMAYGVDVELLLEVLESLMENGRSSEDVSAAESSPVSAASDTPGQPAKTAEESQS
jgi:hybrid cluster-associated redox disulfide protein